MITLDDAVDERQLRKILVGSYNVLHIASHFSFRAGDEKSSVLLLGKGETLRLSKIATFDFSRIEQMTLSACNTATGGGINENGAEVEGLAAAVQKQGAAAVLATLWPVADASTSVLMHKFYAARVGEHPLKRADALRQAQLMLLHGLHGAAPDGVTDRQGRLAGAPALAKQAADPAKPWAHPYFWAPFVLSGNWF
jgi:CHAT domain-containing protein